MPCLVQPALIRVTFPPLYLSAASAALAPAEAFGFMLCNSVRVAVVLFAFFLFAELFTT